VSRPRSASLGFVLVLIGVLACGVPSESTPRALDRTTAPLQLFAPDPTPDPSGELAAQLFFVRANRLVSTPRPVPLPGAPLQVLRALFDGPTEVERSAGLSTAIPAVVTLRGVELRSRIAVVSLDGLGESARADQVTAFAQIVATLAVRDDVDGVQFLAGQRALAVPRGDGSLTDLPLTRSAYAALLGLPPSDSPAAPSAGPTSTPAAPGGPANGPPQPAPPPTGSAP